MRYILVFISIISIGLSDTSVCKYTNLSYGQISYCQASATGAGKGIVYLDLINLVECPMKI